jgi:hypothetical protein
MWLRQKIISSFRELFLHHHGSLEFRAKILTFIILADDVYNHCDKENLQKVAKQIYPNDKDRIEALIYTTEEYIEKFLKNNSYSDKIVQDIQEDLKRTSRFVDKIETNLLLCFMQCSDKEENIIYKKRIIDFLNDLKNQ